MAWERGAWEKRTSDGAKYSKNSSSSYSENITSNSYKSETFSEGLSFCPNCGGMMRRRNDVLTCSMCGNSLRADYSSGKTSTYNEYDEYETINQMNDVLRVMRQGKTRYQAAHNLDIPLSKINRWYQQGSNGINKHASHFYRELKYIEEDRERRIREETYRKNREIENRKRKELQEREERERRARLEREKRKRNELRKREERKRKERLRKKSSDNRIKRQMDSILSQMRSGKTRQQAASYAGVSASIADQWYDKGKFASGEPYKSFYYDVKRIETSAVKSDKSKSSSFIKCSNCHRFYNSSHTRCPHCQKDVGYSKTVRYSGKMTEKMERLISLMETGLSRDEAAQKLGLSVVTVNNWYTKGSQGKIGYYVFYNNVKCIEGASNIYDHSQKPKSSTSNYIKCSICGNKYNKAVDKECPHCENTKSTNIIKCPECKKWYNKNNKECPHCSKSKTNSSLNVNNGTSGGTTINWTNCFILVFIVFVLFAIILLFT